MMQHNVKSYLFGLRSLAWVDDSPRVGPQLIIIKQTVVFLTKMKLRNAVPFATQTQCLPAQFVPFPSICDPSYHAGFIMCVNMEHHVGLCLQGEGNQFQHLDPNYLHIY